MNRTSAAWPACAAALLLLAACGARRPSAGAAGAAGARPSPPPAAAAAAVAASGQAAPASAPPHRRAPATVEEFDAAVLAWRDALGKADAAYLDALRAAFRTASQADARTALLVYADSLQSLKADRPTAPRLRGCPARAAAPAIAAAGLLATAIERRLARVQALSAINDRPLSLPDFAGVAADPTAAQTESAALRAETEKARDAAALCRREAARAAAGWTDRSTGARPGAS